jgi:hypothetical protein
MLARAWPGPRRGKSTPGRVMVGGDAGDRLEILSVGGAPSAVTAASRHACDRHHVNRRLRISLLDWSDAPLSRDESAPADARRLCKIEHKGSPNRHQGKQFAIFVFVLMCVLPSAKNFKIGRRWLRVR